MEDIVYTPGGVYVNGKWVGDYDWPISVNINSKEKHKKYSLEFKKIGRLVQSDHLGPYCSVCGHAPVLTRIEYRGEKIWQLDPKKYNYCSYCGAKMDHSEAVR